MVALATAPLAAPHPRMYYYLTAIRSARSFYLGLSVPLRQILFSGDLTLKSLGTLPRDFLHLLSQFP